MLGLLPPILSRRVDPFDAMTSQTLLDKRLVDLVAFWVGFESK